MVSSRRRCLVEHVKHEQLLLDLDFLNGVMRGELNFLHWYAHVRFFFTHMHTSRAGTPRVWAASKRRNPSLTHLVGIICFALISLAYFIMVWAVLEQVLFPFLPVKVPICFRDTHWIILSFWFTCCDPGNRIPEKIAFKVRKSQLKRAYFRNHLCSRSAPLVLSWAWYEPPF